MAFATAQNPMNIGGDVGGSGISMPGYVPLKGPAIDSITKAGMNSGPSPWALLALGEQSKMRQTANDQGAQTAAGATATANADLASHGGLASGARERTAESGMKDFLAMTQGNAASENANDLQIGLNDEQNKIQQKGTAAQIETQDTNNINNYNQSMYQQQMQAWAAEQQAQATRDAGKK